MRATHIVAILYFILDLLSNTYASKLLFHTSETDIHPVLTKTLRLRCSVVKDANSMGIIESPPAQPTSETLARFETRQLHWGNSEVTKNGSLFMSTFNENGNVTTHLPSTVPLVTPQPYDISSPADITHVMSMIVSKLIYGKSVTIARVTPYDPASASTWVDSSLQVKGNCETSPLSGEQAYLELTWVLPKEEQAGIYTCESYALNSVSLPVSLSTSLQILSSEPSFDDLVTYVVDHDKTLADKEKEIELLNNVSSSLQNQLQELSANCTSEMKDLRAKFELMARPNTESGLITCPFNRFIQFKQEYMVEPLVFTSLVNMTVSYDRFDMNIHVNDANSTGFNLFCTCNYCVSSFKWTAFGYYHS